MSNPRVAKRHKRRLACEVVSEGRPQAAIVLDLSETGLFVQTGTRLPPGSEVEVRLRVDGVPAPISLRARVARNKQVPVQLTSVARGGVGLRIIDAPREYFATIAALDGVPLDARSPEVAPPAPAQLRFRVRVKQCDGPRSRSVEIDAASPDQARTRVLAQVGPGWEAVAAEALG